MTYVLPEGCTCDLLRPAQLWARRIHSTLRVRMLVKCRSIWEGSGLASELVPQCPEGSCPLQGNLASYWVLCTVDLFEIDFWGAWFGLSFHLMRLDSSGLMATAGAPPVGIEMPPTYRGVVLGPSVLKRTEDNQRFPGGCCLW